MLIQMQDDYSLLVCYVNGHMFLGWNEGVHC